MITLSTSICIAAPASVVWQHLADLEAIVQWSAPVLTAHCPVGHRHGVGAERHCTLRGNTHIHERWLAWDEGRSFTYDATGLPLVAQARNHWSVVPYDARSLLVSEATLVLKGGLLGRLLALLVRPVLQRMGANAFVGLKYLIEHGAPYAGPPSDLIPGPFGC